MITGMIRVRTPHFRVGDFNDLATVHRQLDAAIRALERSKTETSLAVIALVGLADQTICALYNRLEPGFQEFREYRAELDRQYGRIQARPPKPEASKPKPVLTLAEDE